MSVSLVQNPQLENLLTELANIGTRGNFSVKPKTLAPKPPTALQPFKGLTPPPSTNKSVTPGIGAILGQGGGTLDKLMQAIRSKESSGRYGAVNPDSGALGAYQIMPFNLFGGSEWDRQALGHDVSQKEFMSNPGIQDAIARYMLGNYLKKYGAAGAAVAWYGGPGSVQNMYSKKTQTGGYPSIYAYWNDVLSRM